ncbi:hypothetical protein BGZ79_001293 [Entomortierella chlamydospora]|nr:hypothetical protein BGZ79_001293 [Entomortierella chlamydospora]
MRKKSERVQFSWVHFIAGGTGGMVGAIVTSPLDVVKTRLQSSLYKNALSESAAASRTGVASVLGHVKDTFVLLGAINFAAYGNGKKYFTDLNHGNESTLVHLSSAAMAGVVTATATNPIWMIKTRMQLQSEGKLRIYRNSFHCAIEILKTEGIRGLYKGLTASLLGVTEGAIQWVIYEHLKRTFAERRIRLAQSSDVMGGDSSSLRRAKYLVGGKHIEEWAEYLGSAGAAKFVASAITYPHEVLRTRMRQTPKGNEAVKYTSLLQTFRLVLKEEGVAALYGGLTAHMLRTVSIMNKDYAHSNRQNEDMIQMDSVFPSQSIHKSEINSIQEDESYNYKGKSLHDDSDLSNDVHGEVGKGLQRNLQARHLTMISLGGTIGTGLFLASGSSIATAGPGYSQVAYTLIGSMVFCFMSSLGEMATYLPIAGSINAYATRFFDPAMGFMLGWVYWFSWSVTLATELVASSLIISYWISTERCPGWVWALVFVIVLTSLNLTSVKAYGEAEYWLSLIKVLAVVVFVIVGFLYIGGAIGTPIPGAPKPGPGVFDMDPFHGGFMALFSIFLNAGFSFQGAELVGIAAGETKNPRKNVPRAIKQVFWRILMFYVLTILIIGMTIPYDDQDLANDDGDIKSSPFTRVFVQAGISVGADIMNAVILVAVLSAGNSGLYASSRALHTLSQEGNAPKFFGKVNSRGVPVYCVLTTALVGCLAFIVSLPQIGQGEAYNWLLSLASTTGFIAWLGIAFCHIRFRMAYKAQGRNLKDLPFVSRLYPFGPIYTIVICLVILFGQGYSAFSPFSIKSFLSAYVTLPFVVILYLGKKFCSKTKILRLVDVDLDTGRSFVDPDSDESDASKGNIFSRHFLNNSDYV